MIGKRRGIDIVTVAVHSGNTHSLIDRMKAHTTEKARGALMIDRLMQLFGLSSYHEIELLVALELEKEKENNGKIQWERDKFGNPTYPSKSNI